MTRWICALILCLAGLETQAETGPRMTDADLLSGLDLDLPGLEKVKIAVSRNDAAAATHELAAYYRQRETPIWRQDGRRRRRGRSVEDAMNRTTSVMGVEHSFGAGNPIDWSFNPTGGESGIAFNPEWTWQLSRHGAWRRLGSAYQETGNEDYAREFAEQLVSWLRHCPRPLEGDVNAAGSKWRTIETGIRMGGSWPSSFFTFRTSPSVDDEALLGMVKGFADHAYHLMPEEHFSPGSNWGLMESNGLFSVGVLFPEFKEAELWRKTAMDRLYSELDRQVYPDGMQIELTSSYHGVSLRNFLNPLEFARLNDIPVPEDYLAKLERMYDYYLWSAAPNGDYPPVNDSGQRDARSSLRQAAELFPGRTDFLWMATGGEEGVRPTQTSYAFPYSGYLAMRSGWDPDDLYMFFDVGPFGYSGYGSSVYKRHEETGLIYRRGHQHEDKLSLITYAYGRHHLADPGTYRYERSRYRVHNQSSFGHNVVLVDGHGQHRAGEADGWKYVVEEPLPHTWISEPDYDYGAGIYDEGYGFDRNRVVTHRRRVLFIKPTQTIGGYWIASDLLTPTDGEPHHYETLFHFDTSPSEVEMAEESLQAVTKHTDSSNFAVCPVPMEGLSGAILAGQDEPVMRGWRQGDEGADPMPVASYTFEAAGTSRALYVLYPIPEGGELPIRSVERVSAEGNGIAARIVFLNGTTHLVIQADQAGKPITAGDLETEGEAAWVAVSESGAIEHSILVNGKELTFEGKSLLQAR